MNRIFLTTFDTREDLLAALDAAGLVFEGEPDPTCVDAFMVWPRVFGPVASPGGEIEVWHDDTSVPAKWPANLAMDECPPALEAYRIDPPAHPRRV